MVDMFHFITFNIRFAAFIVQFILSIFSDKSSMYQHIEEDDVRRWLYLQHWYRVYVSAESLSRVFCKFSIWFVLVVAE